MEDDKIEDKTDNNADDDDGRYSHVKNELNFLRGKVEEHGGILGEIKTLLGGIGGSAKTESDAGSKAAADPEASTENRPAKKSKRRWY